MVKWRRMAAGQRWLFAPACPLVERLGRDFFRTAPTQPGVYSMRDACGTVVYVGKAKDLRKRLRSYRVANPERVSRRHLRLMREVARIDFELCASEPAALAREALLLRQLKPKFNRAGVWPGQPRFLTWRFFEENLTLSVQEAPALGWERFGSLGAYAPRLFSTLVRLLWLALNPQAGFSRLPNGWAQNRFALPLTMACGQQKAVVRSILVDLFWGKPEKAFEWLKTRVDADGTGFDQVAFRSDWEELESFVAHFRNGKPNDTQLMLL